MMSNKYRIQNLNFEYLFTELFHMYFALLIRIIYRYFIRKITPLLYLSKQVPVSAITCLYIGVVWMCFVYDVTAVYSDQLGKILTKKL